MQQSGDFFNCCVKHGQDRDDAPLGHARLRRSYGYGGNRLFGQVKNWQTYGTHTRYSMVASTGLTSLPRSHAQVHQFIGVQRAVSAQPVFNGFYHLLDLGFWQGTE